MSKFTSALLYVVIVLSGWAILEAETGIGVNWGTVSFHRLKPSTVVDLLQENKIEKVKLFDADPDVLAALARSGIQVMVGIPNELLATISSSTAASDLWVRQNVSRYVVKGGVDIRIPSVLMSNRLMQLRRVLLPQQQIAFSVKAVGGYAGLPSAR